MGYGAEEDCWIAGSGPKDTEAVDAWLAKARGDKDIKIGLSLKELATNLGHISFSQSIKYKTDVLINQPHRHRLATTSAPQLLFTQPFSPREVTRQCWLTVAMHLGHADCWAVLCPFQGGGGGAQAEVASLFLLCYNTCSIILLVLSRTKPHAECLLDLGRIHFKIPI